MLKIINHIFKNSLTRILLLQFVLVAILSTIFSLFFSHKITQTYIEKHHEDESFYLDELNQTFAENLIRAENNVALLSRILTTLNGDYTILQRSVSTRKESTIYNGEYMDYYDTKGKCLSCDIATKENQERLLVDSSQWVHTKDFKGRILKHPVYNPTTNEIIGYLMARVSLSRLSPTFPNHSQLQYALTDKNGNLIYATANAADKPIQNYLDSAKTKKLKKGFFNDSINATHIYYIKEHSYSVFFIHKHDKAKDLKRILYISNIAIIVIIFVCFICNAFLIFFQLLLPIKKVNKKIQKIASNNWQGTLSQKTRIKELKALFNILNSQVQLIRDQQNKQNEHRIYLEKTVQKKIEELENANKRLQEISRTDELTGLPNRRDIKEKISLEISRAKRFHSNFALLLFDVDHFKQINDTFGHLAGDYVLKEFANIAKKLLRKYDYAARYGGEEFLIVLPETNQNSALIVAERFRSYIESYLFEYEGQKIDVTISAGISVFDQDLGLEGSLLLADKALYYSKEHGRNRITLWSKDLYEHS